MTGRIPEALLAEIRARTPLPAVVGRRVQLRKAAGVWKGCCPFHSERNPSFAVYDDHFHCYGCGEHGDVIGFVMRSEGMSFGEAVARLGAECGVSIDHAPGAAPPMAPAPAPVAPAERAPDEDAERRRAAAVTIWLAARPSLIDTVADTYLRRRGIDLRQLGRQSRALRFHPALYHPNSKRTWPAIVAAISGGAGRQVATHRTWLAPDGSGKAPVDEPKLTLGSFRGGCIRLWRGASGKPWADAPADDLVAVGEGIETCLSVAIACPEYRILCAVSLGNMGAIELPPAPRSVVLLADNDVKPAARRMMASVIARHIEAGREVRVARSPHGSDFNDALRA